MNQWMDMTKMLSGSHVDITTTQDISKKATQQSNDVNPHLLANIGRQADA